MEEELRFGVVRRFVAEDGDVAIGMEAVDETGARRSLYAKAAGSCGDAAVWLDGDRGTEAPDVGPPRAAGSWPQRGAAFLLGGLPSGERSHGQFAMAFVGVAVEAEFGEQDVEGFEGGDGFRGAEGGEAVLPVLMAAFDFALGLRGRCVTEGDAVKVERGAELGERLGNRREKEAVAINVEAQREAVEEKGAREEVEVGEERLGGIDLRADAAAAAIIEHVEQRVHGALGPPAMGRGVELPKRADLAALPAAHGRLGFACGLGRGEAVKAGETADGGGIEVEAEAAHYLAGGKTVAGGRAAGEELAQEGSHLWGPRRGMIAARGAWQPGTLAALSAGAQIIGVELVEASAAQAEFCRCG